MTIDPAFALLDQEGRAVTERTYRGSYMLVFFGFTHCKVVCPRALARLSDVLERMAPRSAERIIPLYISVDPDRDTPAIMKAFLAARAPKFVGLTGTRSQIDAAKASFRVFARRQEKLDAPDGYVVPHTALTYLIDPHGQYHTNFADTVGADTVIERLESIIQIEPSG
jgi:protein SCO1